MAYPFANNQYAQSSSYGYRGDYTDQQPTQFGSSAARFHHEGPHAGQQHDEYEPSMVARDAQRDTSSVTAYNPYTSGPAADPYKDEKALNHGNSPYDMSPDMGTPSPYTGKSIWTADDKRVMAKRSAVAKIFR